MYPRGTIYRVGSSKHGQINLHLPFWLKVGYLLGRGVGAGLIASAVVGFIFTYGPMVKEELLYSVSGPRSQSETFQSVRADQNATREEAGSLGLSAYFSLYIPKINAKSEIIANVDAGDPKEYLSALGQGIAHAKGTHFPGQGETIFLFSHSTDSSANLARYNAVFYLLRKLEAGDKIIVFFADKKYEYQVTQKLTTPAKDVSWFSYDDGEETLVLQTCDPPGTTFRRLIVVAKRAS